MTKAHPGMSIGHVHLKVSDLDRSIAFYQDVMGLDVTQSYGDQAAFLSAGGYHHHIGLNTWFSKNNPPAPKRSAGLFMLHFSILTARPWRRRSKPCWTLVSRLKAQPITA